MIVRAKNHIEAETQVKVSVIANIHDDNFWGWKIMKELIINGMIILGITFMISSYFVYLIEYEDKVRLLELITSVGYVTITIIICMTMLMVLSWVV